MNEEMQPFYETHIPYWTRVTPLSREPPYKFKIENPKPGDADYEIYVASLKARIEDMLEDAREQGMRDGFERRQKHLEESMAKMKERIRANAVEKARAKAKAERREIAIHARKALKELGRSDCFRNFALALGLSVEEVQELEKTE
jgi:hypothetical protein